MSTKIEEAVGGFIDLAKSVSEEDLEIPWKWLSYEGEGIRFAFFRTFEELQTLAVRLAQVRRMPLSSAQRILGLYHAAYRDLDGALFAIPAELEDQPPAEGEWSVRRTLAHIIGADLGFFVHVKFAVDRYRQGATEPEEISDAQWEEIGGETEESYKTLMRRELAHLQEYHRDLHARILDELEGIEDKLIDRPVEFWEKEALSVRFRLHRFESHMRQHTIQIDKSLATLGAPPTEINRLVRMMYGALAAVENTMIGEPDIGSDLIADAASTIEAQTEEIRALLS